MDDYDWDALNYLEGRCIDGAYIDERECYTDDWSDYYDDDYDRWEERRESILP